MLYPTTHWKKVQWEPFSIQYAYICLLLDAHKASHFNKGVKVSIFTIVSFLYGGRSPQDVPMVKKRGERFELPDWAQTMWEDLGSPELEEFFPIHTGNLLDRRTGLRRDDLIEMKLDVRALPEGDDPWIRGRLVTSGKSSIEIFGEDGKFHYIARDVIVEVVLVAHTRPAYLDDDELLTYERDDMKRRSKLQEKVEKQTEGRDDSHIWG